MRGLRRGWRARRLRRARPPYPLWRRVRGGVLDPYCLSRAERVRLRALAGEFLRRKVITGAQGQPVDDFLRLAVAAQACLPVLNLGLDWYRGWREIIVYPGSFVVERDTMDAAGVVHRERRVLGGEAWDRGPVILAWEDLRPDAGARAEGVNLVLHEFAHKLDMQSGAANGRPPLHRDMDPRRWAAVFSQAYARLQRELDAGGPGFLDPYAASDPAEFFSVASEAFFEDPVGLRQAAPELYDQLRRFYRQDPAARLTAAAAGRSLNAGDRAEGDHDR